MNPELAIALAGLIDVVAVMLKMTVLVVIAWLWLRLL